MKKNITKLRADLAAAKAAGKADLDKLNALLSKATLTAEEEGLAATLEAAVTDHEKKVEDIQADIDAEDKKVKRATLFMPGFSAARTRNEPNPATTAGFHNLAEFAVAVRNAITHSGMDQRLLDMNAAPANYHQSQGAAGEGFLVPLDYRQQIWELAFAENDLLGLVTPEPTASSSVTIGKDETTPWGASGVQANWRSEGSQMSASKIAANQTTVQLHELYAFVLATSEILSDAPRLQDRLTRQAARAIAWKASDAIMWGDGNGKPLGFMNAGALVTVAKESGQAATTLAVANILKMSSRLLRMGGRPMWLGNSDIAPQLEALTIGNVPAFLPMNQALVDSGFEGTLRGRPLLYTEHSQTLGTLGDLAFVDLDGYYAVTKQGGGIDFAASIHLFFDYNVEAFRWTFRLGGQPFLSAPVSPAHGSNTKSHFVTLQAR